MRRQRCVLRRARAARRRCGGDERRRAAAGRARRRPDVRRQAAAGPRGEPQPTKAALDGASRTPRLRGAARRRRGRARRPDRPDRDPPARVRVRQGRPAGGRRVVALGRPRAPSGSGRMVGLVCEPDLRAGHDDQGARDDHALAAGRLPRAGASSTAARSRSRLRRPRRGVDLVAGGAVLSCSPVGDAARQPGRRGGGPGGRGGRTAGTASGRPARGTSGTSTGPAARRARRRARARRAGRRPPRRASAVPQNAGPARRSARRAAPRVRRARG